jgi:hypothetical protein
MKASIGGTKQGGEPATPGAIQSSKAQGNWKFLILF